MRIRSSPRSVYVTRTNLAHADQVNALLSIVLAIIDVLDRKGIMEGLDRLMKRHTVITPVDGARRRRSISALEIR